MIAHSATEVRRMFFRLLDAVQQGEDVVFERDGVRFRLVLDRPEATLLPESPILVLDPDVLAGEWTWDTTAGGELEFNAKTDTPANH